MHQSRLDDIRRRFGEGTFNRTLIYVLVLALGAALVILGFYLNPQDEIVVRFHLETGTTELGFVLIGLGFGGLVASISDDRMATTMVDMLGQGVEEFIATSRMTLAEHVASSHLDLDVPEQYRNTIYFYHQTSAMIEGKKNVFWRCQAMNFSPRASKKRLHATVAVDDPRPGRPAVVYEMEMLAKRNRIIIFHTNVSDNSETGSVSVFDRRALSSVACGFLFVMDWEGKLRVSKAVLASEEILPDERVDNAALDALWDGEIRPLYALDAFAAMEAGAGI